MAGLLAHGVRLTLVLGNASVHLNHNIGSDGGGEDGLKVCEFEVFRARDRREFTGRGWEALLAAPSAPMMETVGGDIVLPVDLDEPLQNC